MKRTILLIVISTIVTINLLIIKGEGGGGGGGRKRKLLIHIIIKQSTKMPTLYLPQCVANLFSNPNDYQDLEVPVAVKVDETQQQQQQSPIDTKCMKYTIFNKISQYTPQLHSSFRLTFKAEPNLELPLYHSSAN